MLLPPCVGWVLRVFAALFAGFYAMRAVDNHRGTRTISLAFLAGLVAFEAVLALGANAVGIPGVLLVSFAGGEGARANGGESVIAKFPKPESTPKSARLPAKEPEAPVLSDMDWSTPAAAPEEQAHQQPAEPQTPGAGEPKHALDLTPEPAVKPVAANAAPPVDDLPWDAVRPDEGLTPSQVSAAGASAAPSAAAHPVQLAPEAKVEAWVKAKATQLSGAPDARDRPLYHFELWLEPPAEMKQRLVAVVYDFGAGSAQPPSQESKDEQTGFRVAFGSLACADKITLTLKFDDGQSQQVAVDGCRLLG